MLLLPRTADIRAEFKRLLAAKRFTSVNREATMTNLTGNTTIEIVGVSFIADEPSIFGKVSEDYIKREQEWYYSQSLNVNDFPGGPPAIWKAVADKDGFIWSNYGHTLFSARNRNQYDHARDELKKNPESRRAVMIYTRPSMWLDYNLNGRSDFTCTNVVQYLIRDGKLNAVVQMRSNDAVFGYKNDHHWQHHILEKLAGDLDVPVGDIIWNAGSLHVYARHYNLVDPVGYPK